MKECIVDLRELGDQRIDLRGSVEPGPIDFSGELPSKVEHLDWSAFIERAGEEVGFHGRLKTVVSIACVRCLETIEQPIDCTFELYFRHLDSLVYDEGADIELEETDTLTSFITGDELQVSGILREQVLLAMPVKPMCRADCRGLCSSCGLNRNTGSCDCPDQPVNPAFEELLELKKRLEERSN